MSWNNILGHDRIAERFRAVVTNGKLASTYLFVGSAGVGKKKFAYSLAQALLCERHAENQLNPCGECSSCVQVTGGTHPDVMSISKPDDKAFIPVELLIGRREKRMREGLCYDISRKPYRGGRKIAIIDDADYFNQESANALLKTLEEPPPYSLILLIGTSEHRQLPTIRSRSQVIRFNSLTDQQVADILRRPETAAMLRDRGVADDVDDDEILELSKLSGGSVELAIEFADPQVREFRQELMEQLLSLEPGRQGFSKTVESFVDAAGKDAAKKRTRMRAICDLAIGCYRQMMTDTESDSQSRPSNFADCIERCLDAQYHSVANMSPANLIESWLSDLGKLSRGEHVERIKSW